MIRKNWFGNRIKGDAVSLEKSFVLGLMRKTALPKTVLVLAALLAILPSLRLYGQGAPPADGALKQNQSLLLAARHSLMGGDVASADRFIREASVLAPTYGEADDRPEYIAALIEQFREAQSQSQVNGMTESVRRLLAKNYLNQAEALRLWRDYDNAEALVIEAQKLKTTPDATDLQSGMDASSVMRRVEDDRLVARAQAEAALPQANALEGLSEAARQQVTAIQRHLAAARGLVAQGKTDEAEEIARRLSESGLPENAFIGGDSPSRLLQDIAVKRSGASALVPPTFTATASHPSEGIRPVQGYELTPAKDMKQSHGYLYVQEADSATQAGNTQAAIANYRDALRYAGELDAETVKRVNDAIVLLTNPTPAAPVPGPSGIDLARSPQELQSEISAFVTKSYEVRRSNPNESLAMLRGLRAEVENSRLESGVKNHFTYQLDLAITETSRFADINGPMIAIENRNKDVEEQIRQKRENEIQLQNRLAEDTQKFNRLLEEGKYEEAEILAKKCRDYSENSVVSIQMVEMARIKKQVAFNSSLKENREAGWLGAMNDVESASIINVSDDRPMAFGPRWEVAKNRRNRDTESNIPEGDRIIRQKLETRITLPFDQPMPLETVMDHIGRTLSINMLIDYTALQAEGITSDTPVETKLSDISVKNYLKHVLTPHNLSYIVANDVLTVTNKTKARGDVFPRTYPVTDLVTPIPNFDQVNSPLSMQAAFDRSYKTVRPSSGAKSVSNVLPSMGNNLGANTMVSPNILAQIASTGNSIPVSNGAGGAGGGNDPSELVGLITSVVDPESWDEVGDPQYFPLTQSLIIRQNEENHQEIRDLLEQLRSLMDCQVAVEVRYVSISDEYFERIGVNFGATFKTSAPKKEGSNGLDPAGDGIYGISSASPMSGKPFTESLNVDFSQNSFGMSVPQFGGYDPSVGAQIGFAILSDIETYFFISAAEADQRTNILQAPKVMMLNGQTATVADQTMVPYVMTVIPVVGEFAVAQMPVTTIINEGQFLSVQAVVSPSRQYVQLTVAPFFSSITNSTRTFKFEGTDSVSTNSTSSTKKTEDVAALSDQRESVAGNSKVSTGTTIQQPIVSTFQVSTTVKVPDGGTVMLGGIKRLSEGRNESGVPILAKIPYLKRLFSNTSVGRATTSMLIMCTPRIVIQDEEEEHLTGLTRSDFNATPGDGPR